MLQKAEVKDLVVQTPLDIEKVFTPDGMSGLLQDIETQVKAHVPVIDTDEGRKDIISLAYKVSRSKSLIVNTGEESIAEHAKKVKNMKVLLKTAKTFLDDLRDETRAPVTEWEAEQEKIKAEEEEAERKKTQNRIDHLASVECVMPFMEVAVMSREEFETLLQEKTVAWNDEQIRLVEEAMAKKEQEENEAAARKAEVDRLAKQKAKQDELEAALKEWADKIAAEQKAIDDEKARIAKEASDKQAAENAQIEAQQRAQADAAMKAIEDHERELAAKEAEDRRVSLLPDIEKIKYWIELVEAQIDDFPHEILSNDRAMAFVQEAVEEFEKALEEVQRMLKEVEKF